MNHINALATIGFVLFFSGCAELTQQITRTQEGIMMPVDEQEQNIKTGLMNTSYFVKKKYAQIKDGIETITTNATEASVGQFFLDKETILKNRKKLITWDGSTSADEVAIIKSRFNSLNPAEIEVSKKFSILNDYFYDEAIQVTKYNFSIKNPAPSNNQYITARENLKLVNEYKTKLNILQNEWDVNSAETRKSCTSKALNALYGKPIIQNIKYSPEAKALTFEISSKKNNFSKLAYIDVDSKTAKEITDYMSGLSVSVFFLNNLQNNLELVGANLNFKNNVYIATFKDGYFDKDRELSIGSDNKIDLSTIDVNYRVAPLKITPPDWYGQTANNSKIIVGYGSSISEEEAKKLAYAEISNTISVNVSSKLSMKQKVQGSVVSSAHEHKINLESAAKKIDGSVIAKRDYRDGLWWVKIEYATK